MRHHLFVLFLLPRTISFMAALARVGVDGPASFDLDIFERAERAIDRIEMVSESFVGESGEALAVTFDELDAVADIVASPELLLIPETEDEDTEAGDKSSGVDESVLVSVIDSSSFCKARICGVEI